MIKSMMQEMDRVSATSSSAPKKTRIKSNPIELSSHDKQQLQDGTAKVRSILGSEAGTDEEIQESLWHYYYDVEKTVNYILSMALNVILPS